ncbi:hypothetical protein BGZ73_008486 [Actinomortierella ambigua]|nr:hypothetical protein BGZ73_008486 [Actinomortierella ambigua]
MADTASDERAQPVVEIVLQIPDATMHHVAKDETKNMIGTGDLRVYSSVLGRSRKTADDSGAASPASSTSSSSSQSTSAVSSRPPPLATFMTLETADDNGPRKSLITHPLMAHSTVEKLNDRTWLFPVPGNGSLELTLLKASPQDIEALDNLLVDRIVYKNQYDLRNSLALVDNTGRIVGVLDTDCAEIEDKDDAVSLSDNKKTPVIVQDADEDDSGTKRIKLKVSLPTSDDMSHWLTTASQYLGEGMIKGATLVAGGIESTHEYLSTKIPETTKPIKISPFIKKRVRNLTSVSRKTYSLTGKVKQAVVNRAVGMAVGTVRSWSKPPATTGSSSSDDEDADPQKQQQASYSSWQQLACALLVSAGILIQSAEASFELVATPAALAAQDLTGKAFGPDAKEVVTDALMGVGQLTLVYFDGFGISRRALLKTGRKAALQTAKEIHEAKKAQQQQQQQQQEQEQKQKGVEGEEGKKDKGESSLSSGVRQVKELIFRYFGHGDKSGAGSETSSDEEGADSGQKHGLHVAGAAGGEESGSSSSSSTHKKKRVTSPKF